ncbi:hypothetical protein TWF730_008600 [Orbilia blumenaviensis]|uniref:Uncharacterized protein n=1 Tax=Orbilia blumenaviensis TaxID=1796055 RepID=A0AAV9V4G5_9PEZI
MSLIERSFRENEVKNILSFTTYLGAASPKYADVVLREVFVIYNQYIRANRFKLTRENLTEDFGTRPSDVDTFFKMIPGGEAVPGSYFSYLVSTIPDLPHPEQIPIIIPLFIALTIMTCLSVGLRMWSRQKVAGGIRSFDWLALVGFVRLDYNIWGTICSSQQYK